MNHSTPTLLDDTWPFRLVYDGEEVLAACVENDPAPFAVIRAAPMPQMHRNRALIELLNFTRDLQGRSLAVDLQKAQVDGAIAYNPAHEASAPLPFNPSADVLLEAFRRPFYYARVNTPHLDYTLEPKDWSRVWSPANGAVHFATAQNLADPLASIVLKLTGSAIPQMYVRDYLQEILEF